MISSVTKTTTSTCSTISVGREDYEVFCNEYIFDQLRGVKFAAAFCKRFSINDLALSILQDNDNAKSLIESLGYVV